MAPLARLAALLVLLAAAVALSSAKKVPNPHTIKGAVKVPNVGARFNFNVEGAGHPGLYDKTLYKSARMQSFFYEPKQQRWYFYGLSKQKGSKGIAHEKKGHASITMLDAGGNEIGHMSFKSAGHGTAFGVVFNKGKATVIVGCDNKGGNSRNICRVPWKNGKTVNMKGKAKSLVRLVKGNAVSVDALHDTMVIRYKKGKANMYRLFSLSAALKKKPALKAISKPFRQPKGVERFCQGVMHFGRYLYLSQFNFPNGPAGVSGIYTIDLLGQRNNGQGFMERAQNTVGMAEERREPEGMCVYLPPGGSAAQAQGILGINGRARPRRAFAYAHPQY